MADNFSFAASLQGYTTDLYQEFARDLTNVLLLPFILPKSTADRVIPLTGLSSPKLLVVKGATEISVKLNGETDSHSANPLFVVSDLDGLTITSLTISNADTTKDHPVTILAGE
jgi:hypothetical protein